MTTGKIYQKKQEEIQGKDLAVIREAREDIVNTRTDGMRTTIVPTATPPGTWRCRERSEEEDVELMYLVSGTREVKRETRIRPHQSPLYGTSGISHLFCCPSPTNEFVCVLSAWLWSRQDGLFPPCFYESFRRMMKDRRSERKKEKLVWIEYAWLEAMSESPFCQSTNNVTDLVFNYLGWRYKTLIRRAHKRCDWLTLWLPPGLGVTGS